MRLCVRLFSTFTSIKTTNRITNLIDEANFKIMDSTRNTTSDLNLSELKEPENTHKISFQESEEINSTQLRYVLDHPKSDISAFYLGLLESKEVMSLDALKVIFNNLDISIQNSKYGKVIQENIRNKAKNSVGSIAPDFKATDILTGKPVTCSEYKGKNVVLINFWASWCGPSRMAFSHLKDLYKKYHQDGFEIIAVSVDWNKKSWTNAIRQDCTEDWRHIPVAESYADGSAFYTNDDIKQNYFVQGIPVQLLIDKDGLIVGRWSAYNIENVKNLDQKLAKLFTTT